MTLPSVPRDPLRQRRSQRQFVYTGCECGHQWTAYKAGKALWAPLHGSRWSKPCLAAITQGELLCDYCKKGVEVIVKGYVPVYRERDYKPCCVCVYEEIRDIVDAMGFHERLVVGRDKQARDPIYIARLLAQEPAFKPLNAEQQAPADVTASCLKLWKNAALVDWYNKTHNFSDTEVSLNAKGKDDGVPVPADSVLVQDSDSGGVPLLGDSFMGALSEDTQREIARRRNEAFIAEAQRNAKKNGKH